LGAVSPTPVMTIREDFMNEAKRRSLLNPRPKAIARLDWGKFVAAVADLAPAPLVAPPRYSGEPWLHTAFLTSRLDGAPLWDKRVKPG
jgi:hypothetical protein